MKESGFSDRLCPGSGMVAEIPFSGRLTCLGFSIGSPSIQPRPTLILGNAEVAKGHQEGKLLMQYCRRADIGSLQLVEDPQQAVNGQALTSAFPCHQLLSCEHGTLLMKGMENDGPVRE